MESRNSFTAGYGRREPCAPLSAPARCPRLPPSSRSVAVHSPHPAQEGRAFTELKLGCIRTGTTRRTRLSENRRDDVTPLDRPVLEDRTVEYDILGKQSAYLGGGRRWIPVVCLTDAFVIPHFSVAEIEQRLTLGAYRLGPGSRSSVTTRQRSAKLPSIVGNAISPS